MNGPEVRVEIRGRRHRGWSTALANQTSAYITAALDAVTMAPAEGSLVAEGD